MRDSVAPQTEAIRKDHGLEEKQHLSPIAIAQRYSLTDLGTLPPISILAIAGAAWRKVGRFSDRDCTCGHDKRQCAISRSEFMASSSTIASNRRSARCGELNLKWVHTSLGVPKLDPTKWHLQLSEGEQKYGVRKWNRIKGNALKAGRVLVIHKPVAGRW